MRMWMVDPRILCNQHLLGEHAEIHMFVGAIDHGFSVKGYLDKGLLETQSLYSRHVELAEEMERRNYRHKSKIANKWKRVEKSGHIDRQKNLKELISRCPRCAKKYHSIVKGACSGRKTDARKN
jgi:hypothetical protein